MVRLRLFNRWFVDADRKIDRLERVYKAMESDQLGSCFNLLPERF